MFLEAERTSEIKLSAMPLSLSVKRNKFENMRLNNYAKYISPRGKIIAIVVLVVLATLAVIIAILAITSWQMMRNGNFSIMSDF